MTFPNFEGKHAGDAFFTPSDYLAYLEREELMPDGAIPPKVILCYQPRYFHRVVANMHGQSVGGAFDSLYRLGDVPGVGVIGGFGVGAPVAATVLEELIALGVHSVISIGTAGGLAPGCQVGDTVVCDGAIRDEGTSHHYLSASKSAYPSEALTGRLQAELDLAEIRYSTGASWTIDAPYRETVEEARHYQSEGVLTVEMEASALFAVASVRGVDIATAFVISDSLAELVWQPGFRSTLTADAFDRLARAACAALTEHDIVIAP